MINMIYKYFSVCIVSRYDQHLVKLYMIWWVFCFLLTKQPLQGGSTATVASVGRISPKSAKLMAFSPHAAGGRTGRNGTGFLSEATPNSWMVFISWKDPPSFLMEDALFLCGMFNSYVKLPEGIPCVWWETFNGYTGFMESCWWLT